MNVYFTKECRWEHDFFKNDIFKKDLYKIEINFIQYDYDSIFKNNNEHNIIIANEYVNINFLENMIKNLQPFIIFHLSDEFKRNHNYYDLYSKYNIKKVFHNYNYTKNYYNKLNTFQIPLGYVSGYLSNESFVNNEETIYKKKYDFSFVGSLKTDRINMLNKFLKNFENNFVNIGQTDWSSPVKQNIKPHELFNIYKESLFVPIGRGNSSLDCFRIYEAIVAGAIPVICSSVEESNLTFEFNNEKPEIIIADTWDKAIIICNNLYNDKEKIKNIINYNKKWFEGKIIHISKIINELL